eukprot:1182804-Prorocentrum_minimum.AAC.1
MPQRRLVGGLATDVTRAATDGVRFLPQSATEPCKNTGALRTRRVFFDSAPLASRSLTEEVRPGLLFTAGAFRTLRRGQEGTNGQRGTKPEKCWDSYRAGLRAIRNSLPADSNRKNNQTNNTGDVVLVNKSDTCYTYVTPRHGSAPHVLHLYHTVSWSHSVQVTPAPGGV